MIVPRNKPFLSLNDRLKLFSDQLKAQATALRPGPGKEALLKRARQAETASRADKPARQPSEQR